MFSIVFQNERLLAIIDGTLDKNTNEENATDEKTNEGKQNTVDDNLPEV